MLHLRVRRECSDDWTLALFDGPEEEAFLRALAGAVDASHIQFRPPEGAWEDYTGGEWPDGEGE